MEATVDKKTGSVSIRLSRVLQLLESFDTGAARDFADVAGRILLSEGDPAFEFYSRTIWPRLRGLVPLLFFRESMGKFFLGVVDSRSRRAAAGLTDEDAEMLRSLFGAGCNPEMALDTLFLTVGELDFSPAEAAGLRPLTLVDRRKERIPADCLAGSLRVSYIISVLESCRDMLTDPSYLDAVVEQLARTPNSFVSVQTVVAMLNRAYGDPAAVSVDDILVVRERIVEILPFFAEYPPATESTAPYDVHYEVTVTENACDDVLVQAAAALRAFVTAAQAAGVIDEGEWPGLPAARAQAARALASPGDPSQVMPAARAFADAALGVGLDRVAAWPELLASYRMASDALSCCDLRLRLPQAAPGAQPQLPCLVAPGDAVRPPFGSRVEVLADILLEHPYWPIQIPAGTRGTVTHADGDGTLRVRWHEFEWPRFPLPIPGEGQRRGYEVRSFPLTAEQYGLVRVLDNAFVVPAAVLEACGAPEEVSDCVRAAAECLLGKFRCLSFDSAFSLCPSPSRLTHRLCVSCGARLDLRGFWFPVSVIALLDRLISQSEGMRRKLTEKFSEDFAKSKLDAFYLRSVRLWRGFGSADSIVVSGDMLCAEWLVPNVRPLPQALPPQCEGPVPCAIRAREFPNAAALSEALSATEPTPDQTALIESSAGEVAADILANMRCCCTDFGVRSGGETVGLSWGLKSSYDIEGFGPEFVSMAVDELGKLLQCNRFAVRKMREAAREGLRRSRAAVGYPPSLGELWNASCGDPNAARPLSVSDFLGPWLDPSLTGSRKWSLASPAEGSQVAGLLVEPDLAAPGKKLSRVRLRAATAPAGSDLLVRLENIDADQRADAYLRVGETDRTSYFAVPFLPGERMSGVVFLSDSASAAANVDVEVWFDEGDGGRSAVVYALPGPVKGEHFVGQAPLDPSGGEMTLTTLCVEMPAPSAADLTLRAYNLDTEVRTDVTVPAGAVSVSVPVSIHFAPTDRLSIRVLAAADPPSSVSVTGIGRVGGASEEAQPLRTVLRELPLAASGEPIRTEPLSSAQDARLVRLSASPPPSGRPVVVTVQNLSTARFASAELAVGAGASETAVSLGFEAGEAMGASVAQEDDGMVTQSVSYPAEPVSTAPPPLHDTMRLYDEDSSGVTSEVVEASVSLESPPRGSSLTVRFESADTGEWQDITVPPGQSGVSGPIGLILPDGGRLRVTLLRSGFGAAGLGVRWSRRMPPASGLRVGVVSEVRPPATTADAQSCGLRDRLEEFVRRECAEAVEPDEFVLRLDREFGWPFASRLATEGLTVWGIVSGENLERVVAGDVTLYAEWRHDDLTPEFLASLPSSPQCPEEPDPAQPCPLEAKLLDGLDAEVVETVAASLVASLKSLRLEFRNLGGDDGGGLVVCVRTGEDICFLDSRPDVVLAILNRFGELIQGDRRDALRKAIEHANDIRERVRVPQPPDPLSGLGRPARKLDHPRLPEDYLLSALLSRDPLLTTEGGETSFVFFGGGRDAMADYLRGLGG